MGEDPFAAYADLDKYQQILDKVADKLISCKDNIKAYWKGGDDLSAMMMSGEIVASETWDSTAYKLLARTRTLFSSRQKRVRWPGSTRSPFRAGQGR